MRTVLCEGCDGLGYIQGSPKHQRKRCRVCEGTGRMEILPPDDGIVPLAYTVAGVIALVGAIWLWRYF